MNNKVKMNDICGNVRKFAPKFVIEYSMRRIFHAFCGLLTAALSLTSCLSSNDDSTTTYNDMAITSFTLGTLNRYLHTTSSAGADSVYKTTYAGSTYKMSIDQIGHRIYNRDSLLRGTDPKHVICTVTTRNSGVVYVKSTTSDTLVYLNSGTDSIDLSVPRTFRVYASDGSGSRDYTVTLNVRRQDAGVFYWTAASQSDFPTPSAAPIDWTKEQVDDTDSGMMPQKELSHVTWHLNVLTSYTLLAGVSEASPKYLVLWRKVADADGKGRWVYMTPADNNPYRLPVMDNVQLVYYNDAVLAFGSNGHIYVSRDQGITWKTTATYTYPAGFNATQFAVAIDGSNRLWLTDLDSGQTWMGLTTD